jgi:hypothetical protein
MSWNKNTIVSDMDSIIHTLENAGIPYAITVEKTVKGRGLNDMYLREETIYPLRRLIYSDKVVLEQMQQNSDCDVDDVIVTVEFKKDNEPKDFQFVVIIDNDEIFDQKLVDLYKEYGHLAGEELKEQDYPEER